MASFAIAFSNKHHFLLTRCNFIYLFIYLFNYLVFIFLFLMLCHVIASRSPSVRLLHDIALAQQYRDENGVFLDPRTYPKDVSLSIRRTQFLRVCRCALSHPNIF